MTRRGKQPREEKLAMAARACNLRYLAFSYEAIGQFIGCNRDLARWYVAWGEGRKRYGVIPREKYDGEHCISTRPR